MQNGIEQLQLTVRQWESSCRCNTCIDWFVSKHLANQHCREISVIFNHGHNSWVSIIDSGLTLDLCIDKVLTINN